MDLIDSHCHLESFYAKGELDTALAGAAEAGVKRLITIGTSTDDWPLYQRLATEYAGQIDWTVGLHPCDVAQDWQRQLDQLPGYCEAGTRPVALGEIGLDYFHLPKDEVVAAELKVWQEAAFRRQLDLATRYALPIVVHSRNAFADCLRVIDDHGFPWERVVLHCFADGAEEMRALNKRGGRGSFTGIVTYKSAQNVREACREQGLGKLMVETDAPYLAPVPHRGKRCEPAMVRATAEFIAREFELSLDELAAQVTANTVAFFGLD